MLRRMNEASPIATAAAKQVSGGATLASHKVGLLLVNLGTPEGYDTASVRRYLR